MPLLKINAEQEQALNDWSRTTPGLAMAFGYTSATEIMQYGEWLKSIETQVQDNLDAIPEDESVLTKRFDFSADGNTIYKGFADPGADETASVWKISRVIITPPEDDLEELFASGVATFTHKWSDRLSLTYI